MAIFMEPAVFNSGPQRLAGFLARPQEDGPWPGVVVIHEVFGLNDNIKRVAERFAGQGYVALAVDLFTGRNRLACMFRFMAGMLTDSLGHQGINDLKASLSYLLELPYVDRERVGAIGFCMGGSFAVAWGSADNRLKVIAPFYGMNPRPLEAVRRACPVVGSYPGQDFTAPMARKLDDALTRYNIRHDIKIYPGARHSFFNDQGPSYDPAASQDAWQRTLSFFREQFERE